MEREEVGEGEGIRQRVRIGTFAGYIIFFYSI